MLRNTRYSCLLLLIASLCSWIGALHATSGFSHDRSDLEPDPTVVWGTLDNGFRYVIMPNREPPGRVSLRLYVDAGSLMETDAQQGIAHFLEHMAFNGTRHFGPGEMVAYFQRIGMAFGGDTNAHTGFDETVYKIELPENTETYLNEGLQVLRDYADGMLLVESEIDRERGVILSEKRDRDSVDYRIFTASWSFLFPEAKISKRFPIGQAEVISNAPRQEFVDFYERWYTPNRMALVVVGDVDPASVADAVVSYFGDMESRPKAEDPDLGNLWLPEIAAQLHTEPEAQATQISIIAIKPYTQDADTREMRIQGLIETAANRMLTRRLDRLSREENAPFSGASAYVYDYLKFFEMAAVELVCLPEKWEATLMVGEQELRRALEYGFTVEEINEAKADILNGFEQAVRQASTRQSRHLSDALVRSLERDKVFMSPEQELEIARDAMERLTPESALAALRGMWENAGRFLFLSGNLALENAPEKILEVYQASVATPLEPWTEDALPEWPYSNWGEAGKVVEERLIEDLEIRQALFGNQVRLNFKHTDFEAGRIRIAVRFGSGLLEEPETLDGIAVFAGATFIAGGLEALSEDQFQRLLAGRTVHVAFSVEEGAFVLRGMTNSRDLRLQMELLAAYLMYPGYREEAARLARSGIQQLYKRLRHTVEGVLEDQVERFLSGGNFRFGYPEESVLLSRTMDEVREWLTAPLTGGYLEISVVGDAEWDDVRDAVAATFGTLPARAENPPGVAKPGEVRFPEGVAEKTFEYPTAIMRAAAVVYWPTTWIRDIDDSRRLSMLASIFTEKLREEVRQKIGEGYSPYASNNSTDVFPEYGYFYAINLADPGKAVELTEIMKSIGASLAAGEITEDDLTRARLPLLNMLRQYVRNNQYWLNRVLLQSQAVPENLEWARTLRSSYESMTLEEIKDTAARYLTSEKALRVIVLPVHDEAAPSD